MNQELETQRGAERLESVKERIARGLREAAGVLNKNSMRRSESDDIAALGRRAASLLDRSADYVSDFDPERVKNDVTNQVRRNPGRSLLIAAAAGLVVGALVRRR
jgi:ElaB/YqjD/DUF883 family membrane-anchored ribosome-binding protein